MKKLLLIFVLLSCFAGAFAETGYNGTEWNRKRSLLDFGEKADEWQISQEQSVVSFGSVALGDDTIKIYFFEKEKLTGVSYYIPEGTLKDLLSKFDSKKEVAKIQTPMFTVQEIFEGLEKLKKEKNLPSFIDGSEEAEIALSVVLAELSLIEIAKFCETKGYKNLEKTEDPGTLYIYDYNNDTRVYIAAGNIKGLVFVAYVPHFKDY